MAFVKGQSGNPAGRRKGSRNKVTELAEELAGASVEEMTRRLLSAANDGKIAAMRLYFDRIWPKRRGAPIAFEMPEVRSSADVPVALAAICRGVTDGELSVEEFETLSRGVQFMKRSLDEAEIDARFERHEAMLQAMAKGIGATFDFAPTSWEVDEPDGERPEEVRFAAPEESQETDVACATDQQEESVAPAADLQAGAASATNLQGDFASATDLQSGAASAMNLQDAQDARPRDARQANRKANGHDEAWMHDFLRPEYTVPWNGHGGPPEHSAP